MIADRPAVKADVIERPEVNAFHPKFPGIIDFPFPRVSSTKHRDHGSDGARRPTKLERESQTGPGEVQVSRPGAMI